MTETIKRDILSLTRDELDQVMAELGEKKFRAKQVYEWLHRHHAQSFDDMTNLSKGLREKLSLHYRIPSLQVREVLTSKLDGTQKFLFALEDGNVIESVLMRYHYGLSACISSQVGCRMGCKFCASTIGGRVRDLSAGEMISQVTKMSSSAGERISHVVKRQLFPQTL